jgi:putative Mn2+ efflux pump MntP
MDLASTLLIAIGLSMDCLAVAIAGGISIPQLSTRHMLRASLLFGLFQAGMFTIGWFVGQTIVDLIESFDHWVAFGLLACVGIRMIWESFRSEAGEHKAVDITKGSTLIILSLATSIDALAVGFSFAFINSNTYLAAVIIGIVAFSISLMGFRLGIRIGGWLGRWAELFGGIILLGIGVRVLLTHIL